MKNVILSAFGKFGDYPVNSSAIVANRLHETEVSGFVVNSVIFPANIPCSRENRGAALFTIAQSLGAGGIISLGMASEKAGLCIELAAKNMVQNTKYCPRELNGTPVDANRPLGEVVSLDLRPWDLPFWTNACREKDVPIMGYSRDAGGFCCNHLAYQARIAQIHSGDWRNIPFIFIHIPCAIESVPDAWRFQLDGKITMSVDIAIEGIEILLANASF